MWPTGKNNYRYGTSDSDCATTLETTDTLDSVSQVSFRPQLNITVQLKCRDEHASPVKCLICTVSALNYLPQSRCPIFTSTNAAYFHLNHFVRYNSVCYILSPWYSICQCGHPIHSNELLIRILPYLVHYHESIAPKVLHFYSFNICR